MDFIHFYTNDTWTQNTLSSCEHDHNEVKTTVGHLMKYLFDHDWHLVSRAFCTGRRERDQRGGNGKKI